MSAAAPKPRQAVVPYAFDGTAPSAPPVRIDVRYVDEPRSHHVHARVVDDPAAGTLFLVVESPGPRAAAEDTLVTRIPIRDGWEARFHQADLEGRLAQMGRYWRHDRATDRWLALRRHPGVPQVDLRAVEWTDEGRPVGFHQFHHGGSRAKDQLLVTVARTLPAGVRYLLADLEFDFPRAETGDLRILHERLAPGPLRSLLTREHMDFARRGYAKLVHPREFAFLYGPDWQELMRSAFAEAMARIREGRTGPGAAPMPAERDDGLLTDYQRLLADPRLVAVHRRFLPPEEEATLLASNEVTIRRWVASKRRGTEHASQHLLSLLEASLLARLGLRTGSHVDPVVAKQLRRLAYYL